MFKRALDAIPFFFFLFASAVCVYVSLHPFHEPSDMFWHVAHGRDFVEFGLGATKDRFSFTMPGVEVTNLPWVFQILSHYFYDNFFGHLGLQLFRAILWLLPLAILSIYFSYRKTPWFIQCLAYLYAAFSGVAFYWMRPELVSYSFTLAMMLLLLKGRETWNPRLMLVSAGLLIIWVNFHASAVFGFVIIGALYFEWLVRFLKEKKKAPWIQFFGIGIFTLLTGCLTPEGPKGHPLLAILSFDPEWRILIKEYIPWKFWDLNRATQSYMIPLGLTFLYFLRRQAWSVCLIIGVLFYQAQSMNKIWLHMIIASLPPVIFFFEEAVFYISKNIHKLSHRAVLAVLYAGLFYAPIKDLIAFCQIARPSSQLKVSDFATDVMEFMNKTNRFGKVYADYELGGVITAYSKAKSKVYIDGRTNVLYNLDIMKNYLKTRKNINSLIQEIYNYDIDYVLLPRYAMQFLEVLERKSDLRVVFIGEGFILFSRKEPETLITQKLYFTPQCLDELNIDKIILERSKLVARGMSADNTILQTLAEMTQEYLAIGHKDPTRFFYMNSAKIEKDDGLLRFAAYIAQKNKFDRLAADYLKKVKAPTINDFLTMAQINVRNGFYEVAESQLAEALNNMPYWYYKQGLAIADEIQKKGFKRLTQARLNEIRNELQRLPAGSTDPKEFCNTSK